MTRIGGNGGLHGMYAHWYLVLTSDKFDGRRLIGVHGMHWPWWEGAFNAKSIASSHI